MVQCQTCGEEFYVQANLVGKSKYCCRECYRISQLGKTPPNLGIPHTEETKNKISIANTGKHHSEESRQRTRTGGIILCQLCSTEFYVPNCRKDIAKYCSKKCAFAARVGIHLSDEHRRNVSRATIGKIVSDETRQRMSLAAKGKKRKPFTQEHKDKIRETLTGRPLSEKTKHKLSLAMTDKPGWCTGLKLGPLSQETRDKLSKIRKGKKKSEDHKRKIGEAHKGMHHTEESKKQMSESHKRNFQDPKYANNYARKFIKRPTKPELITKELLNTLCPDEWKYVGNGGVYFGRCNPDFINVNGQKKIIEVFGEYWHRDRTNKPIPYYQTEEGRKVVFSRFGYQTLVIWSKELEDIPTVTQKILAFVEDK